MAGGEARDRSPDLPGCDVTRVTVQRSGLQGGSGSELVPHSVAEGAGRRDLGQPDSRVGQRKWRERPARTVVGSSRVLVDGRVGRRQVRKGERADRRVSGEQGSGWRASVGLRYPLVDPPHRFRVLLAPHAPIILTWSRHEGPYDRCSKVLPETFKNQLWDMERGGKPN